MLVPKSFIDDLRARTRLSDIIGRRVKLTRAGREFKACCPFHHEKSPSFYVNDEKGFYHCFGCGAHGDQIGFLTRHDNRSFMDAVEELAGLAGMSVPKASPQEIERAAMRDRLVALMDAATKFYSDKLFEPSNSKILGYLYERALTEETIHAFRLGYSPADSGVLMNHLKTAGFTEGEMIEAGLFKKSDRGGQPFAFFRDRVMFPVTDRRGRTIAFGARVLPENLRPLRDGESKPPKYINSGETALFQKGQILYNESHARTAAARGAPVIVCEGYADVIALWQAGFTGAVAPLGTALTEAQIGALWSMTPEDAATTVREPILCFDGDAAGQRAADKAMQRIIPLLQTGKSARFAMLTGAKDPDDLIRTKGKEAMDALLQAAIPLSDMVWQSLTSGHRYETPEARASLQSRIDGMVAQIADRAVQKEYQSILRDKFFKAFTGANRTKAGKVAAKINLPDPKTRQAALRARVSMAAVLLFPEIFHEAEDILGRMEVGDSQLDALRQGLITHLSENPDLNSEGLIAALNEDGYAIDVQAVLSAASMHGMGSRENTDSGKALQVLSEAAGAGLTRTHKLPARA